MVPCFVGRLTLYHPHIILFLVAGVVSEAPVCIGPASFCPQNIQTACPIPLFTEGIL